VDDHQPGYNTKFEKKKKKKKKKKTPDLNKVYKKSIVTIFDDFLSIHFFFSKNQEICDKIFIFHIHHQKKIY